MTTLSQLKTEARQVADQENSLFVSESELTTYINDSYSELYDLLISLFEDYFIQSDTFTLTAGTNTSALPATFFKLRGVDLMIGGSEDDCVSLAKFNFAERNSKNHRSLIRDIAPHREYRLLGQNIHITPKSNCAGDYKLWFIPKVTALSSDSDELEATCDIWKRYIVVDTAIKMMQKEESDITALYKQKQDLIRRIVESAKDRDANQPEAIADVTGSFDSNILVGDY